MKWKLVDENEFSNPFPFLVIYMDGEGNPDPINKSLTRRFAFQEEAIRCAEILVDQGERVTEFKEIKFCVKIND